MALNTSSLHRAMVRAFSVGQTTNSNFNEDFIQAVNNSLDELTNAAALTTVHAHVVAHDADISTLSGRDQHMLQAGVVVHLCLAGWPHRAMGDDAQFLSRVALPMWADALGMAMVRQSRDVDQASSTQDDDGVSETDVVGLGYTGDE